MNPEAIVLTALTLIVFAGVAVLWIAMLNRRHIRELEHRERLAMIDRGLIPPPELDPATFEMRTGLTPVSRTAARTRSAGVLMIGMGLALMLLLAFTAGEPGVGIGVGGAFALLGAAFLVNATLASRSEPPLAAHDPYRRPAPPPQPPPNSPTPLT